MPIKVMSDIRDELRAHGIPHERVDEIMSELIVAGQNVICASLGEIGGAKTVDPKTLRMLVATVVAQARPNGI